MEGPKSITNEREQEHVKINAGLILRICQDDKIQPREKLLAEFDKSGRTDNEAMTLRELVLKMPDYNLDDLTDFDNARAYLEYIFKTKNNFHEDNNNWDSEMMKDWIRIGIFAYQLTGDGKVDNKIVIHIPPTDQSPKLGQIKESLNLIAQLLERSPDITEVGGSSLLLIHPLAKRFGFIAQPGNDSEPLVFKMSREEFINRFG
ncbi:MAG: hypothetical protein WC027_01515 [Candidatus Paceibacterota bacterium]